jgi:rhodanese-related sulfurtransferase
VDPEVPEIDIDTLVQERDVPLVDVREEHEFEDFHVPGAQLLPMSELQERVDEVPADGKVFIICRTGARSHRVAEFLRNRGVDAVNVAGGSLAWADAGHPVATGLDGD